MGKGGTIPSPPPPIPPPPPPEPTADALGTSETIKSKRKIPVKRGRSSLKIERDPGVGNTILQTGTGLNI